MSQIIDVFENSSDFKQAQEEAAAELQNDGVDVPAFLDELKVRRDLILRRERAEIDAKIMARASHLTMDTRNAPEE
jgi:uncharacterized membrane protein